METVSVDLKQVLGAIIFAAKQPMTVAAIRKVLQETGEAESGDAALLGGVKDAAIRECLHRIQSECESSALGVHLIESAEGFRFQSDPAGGPWVRHMLNVGKPTRLSRPALETLAIIAYRQPISRAELEGVRGVAVDHVIRMLMEMQLIRIVGRSELPGRPMLYGTTALFLEHFGLKDVKELPGINELARMDAMRKKQEEAGGGVPAGVTVDAEKDGKSMPESDVECGSDSESEEEEFDEDDDAEDEEDEEDGDTDEEDEEDGDEEDEGEDAEGEGK